MSIHGSCARHIVLTDNVECIILICLYGIESCTVQIGCPIPAVSVVIGHNYLTGPAGEVRIVYPIHLVNLVGRVREKIAVSVNYLRLEVVSFHGGCTLRNYNADFCSVVGNYHTGTSAVDIDLEFPRQGDRRASATWHRQICPVCLFLGRWSGDRAVCNGLEFLVDYRVYQPLGVVGEIRRYVPGESYPVVSGWASAITFSQFEFPYLPGPEPVGTSVISTEFMKGCPSVIPSLTVLKSDPSTRESYSPSAPFRYSLTRPASLPFSFCSLTRIVSPVSMTYANVTGPNSEPSPRNSFRISAMVESLGVSSPASSN